MARGRQKEVKQDTNAWMTTYTDLMILLLTFFVLLLSISIIDSRKQRDALNSLVGAFGFKPGAHSVIGDEKGLNVTVGSAPITKEEVEFERLQNIIFKNGLEGDVEIKREREKLVLSLTDKVLFEQGSTVLESDAEEFLRELAPYLKDSPGIVELRGYAHSTETIFHPDPYKRTMYLSARRALSVFEFLHDVGKIPANKMVAHGFGAQTTKKRIADGSSGEMRRQVEIVCDYRRKIPQRLRDKTKGEDLLFDFKGFLFRLKGGRSG